MAEAIEAAAPGSRPTFDEDTPLPLPAVIDGSALDARIPIAHRPVADAIQADIEQFRSLLARGLIDAP